MCLTCTNDGEPNVDYLTEIGLCTFGCGSRIDPDLGFCPECRDHSANRAVCEDCGAEYEDWGNRWQIY